MSTANADNTAPATPAGVDRRKRLHDTIAGLIRLRQKTIESYCALAGIDNFAQRDAGSYSLQIDQLRNFCEVMVDYTAMGHFEVYQRIREGKERRRAVKEVAEEVYPAIAESTDYLIDFNDRFDAFQGSDADLQSLNDDLSRLGDIIALRSDLEDQILAALGR